MHDDAVTAQLAADGSIGHDAAADDAQALVLAGLAVSTLQALRDHAAQHDWDIAGLRCGVRLVRDPAGDVYERILTLERPLAESHRARLLEVAGRTDVTRQLQSATSVVSTFM